MTKKNYAKVSMLIRTNPSSIYEAFVDPKLLSRFWLKRSSGRLERGVPVEWEFMVPGAIETTTATKLLPNEQINFYWSDGVEVKIAIEKASRSSSITRISFGPFSSASKTVDAAEGFCIVLCDLRIFLESGKSPGLVKDKAKLISGL